MQPCLVVTQQIRTEVLELLSHSFRVIPNMTREPLPREELFRRSREADALMVFLPDAIDRAFLDACPRLKIIAATFEGSGNVDVEACTEYGIWFTAIQHDPFLPPDLASDADEVLAGNVLEAASCIFEALSGETPKSAINHPFNQEFMPTVTQP